MTEESKPSAEQLKPPSYYRDPRPTLTDEEREAISEACDEGRWYPRDYHHIRTLRGLLERIG